LQQVAAAAAASGVKVASLLESIEKEIPAR
jgi:hypothetical protein